jgi:hypothetical protein
MRTQLAALAALGAAVAVTAIPSAASAAPSRPDTACQRAGITTLQSAGLLDDVARGGLPISLALDLGVTVRSASTDVSALPDPLPLSLILADHRAGASSVFVYPWC